MHRRRVVLLVVVLALAVAGYWWNGRRHVGLRDAVNPAYWVRRRRGQDLYDPRTRLLMHGNRSLPEVALTFDDGPHEGTGKLLDLLRAEHVRVTFFLVGANIKKHPEFVRRIVAEGHDAGNHTQDHLRLSTLTDRQVRNEIVDCDINFQRATKGRLQLLRPPGENYTDADLQVARELGYTTVGYTWGAEDYDPISPEVLVDGITRRTENGSIIILHDGSEASMAALPRIIANLTRAGYRFVTISEMLAHLPKTALAAR